MKTVLSILTVCNFIMLTPLVAAAEAIIVSSDGEYLGKVSNDKYASESICNQHGTFGSKYGTGIFNRYGNHGGAYSLTGAYNPMAQNPPALIEDGEIVGFVTKNPTIRGRIDPDVLRAYICD